MRDDVPSKTVGQERYFHVNALPQLEGKPAELIAKAQRVTGLQSGEDFNVVRMNTAGDRVALLSYPGFFEEPFPALKESWLVTIETGSVSYRTYVGSANPPILHRKELLLSHGDPRREECVQLTQLAERIGLFDNPKRIGYRRQWEDLIRAKGFLVKGTNLVPIGNGGSEPTGAPEIEREWKRAGVVARHLTALTRYGFSAPIQTLAKYGFLDGRYTVFDYGCGRGSDVRGLVDNGITASGWDPHFSPDERLCSAHIVNLGFVINVIENLEERVEALTQAYSLAKNLLVVAVMLADQNGVPGERFGDGVVTKRGTFQKYYSRVEIRAFLANVLGEEPIPIAPGVLYVFRDKDFEQRFLSERYRRRRNLLRAPSVTITGETRWEKTDRARKKYEAYREPLDRLWAKWLDLGRTPDKSEAGDLVSLTEGFGSFGRAIRFLEGLKDGEELEGARAGRIEDLEVYFALNQFERRKAYGHLEQGLQRDIRAFFGDYRTAQEISRELLFKMADVEAVNRACRDAADRGFGWVEEGASLQLHTSMVERLPALLRVYVGCASVFYGDYREADLVKIHIRSGKLSLMRYEEFEGSPLPRLIERVKINLREQEVAFFGYGGQFEPPLLFNKSRYINEEFGYYPDQEAFDQALEDLGLFDLSGYGPKPQEFSEVLAKHWWEIDGFTLRRAQKVPDLDEHCGQYLAFRQLIECGETQAKLGVSNLPNRPESYAALYDLAVHILDPVMDYFGMVRLTYGFCSPELAKAIPGRVDPARDQHSACEINRRGHFICPRLGAAADFVVEDEDMLEIAQWVVAHTPFDRLYYYGREKPIHVSFGPEHTRQVVVMRPGPSGKLVPKVTSPDQFLKSDAAV